MPPLTTTNEELKNYLVILIHEEVLPNVLVCRICTWSLLNFPLFFPVYLSIFFIMSFSSLSLPFLMHFIPSLILSSTCLSYSSIYLSHSIPHYPKCTSVSLIALFMSDLLYLCLWHVFFKKTPLLLFQSSEYISWF
jgi:hypothetical protein